MRNEKLVDFCEKLAKQASEHFKNGNILQARVYAGLALDFLKLANATPSDFKKISELLPNIDEERVEASKKLSVGNYKDGRWEVW